MDAKMQTTFSSKPEAKMMMMSSSSVVNFNMPPSSNNNNNNQMVNNKMMMMNNNQMNNNQMSQDVDFSVASSSGPSMMPSSSASSDMMIVEQPDAQMMLETPSSKNDNTPFSTPMVAPAPLQQMLQRREQQLQMDPKERYSLLKRLRHSIFGEVYFGIDKCTGMKVAVKVSVKELLKKRTSRNNIEVLEDPLHEASIMSSFAPHLHVTKLVATHEDEKLHWMVLEFVAGGELFDLLVRHGHFDEHVSRHFFLCLLAGLQHVHRANVCHLDVSLENMLVDEQSYAKLCDFGLARKGRYFPGNKHIKPGKINYMAPEILAGKDFDGRLADVFSAGVVLFTMLTGHPPFECASLEDERYRLIAEGRLSTLLSALRMTDRVPVLAVELLTKMLAYDPAKRPQCVEECAKHPWVAHHNVAAQQKNAQKQQKS